MSQLSDTRVFIKLTKGMVAIVCNCHVGLIRDYHWQYHKNGYAVSGYYDNDGKHHFRRMHRIVNNTPVGFDTDHINRNKLDNRCSNLRTATRSQNNLNSGLRSDNTSGYKGVTWDKVNNKWVAQYQRNGITKKIGRFSSVEAAQEALYAHSSNLSV